MVLVAGPRKRPAPLCISRDVWSLLDWVVAWHRLHCFCLRWGCSGDRIRHRIRNHQHLDPDRVGARSGRVDRHRRLSHGRALAVRCGPAHRPKRRLPSCVFGRCIPNRCGGGPGNVDAPSAVVLRSLRHRSLQHWIWKAGWYSNRRSRPPLVAPTFMRQCVD